MKPSEIINNIYTFAALAVIVNGAVRIYEIHKSAKA